MGICDVLLHISTKQDSIFYSVGWAACASSSVLWVISSVCQKTVRERHDWGSHKCPRLMDYRWMGCFFPSLGDKWNNLFSTLYYSVFLLSSSFTSTSFISVPHFSTGWNWIFHLFLWSVVGFLMAGCFSTYCIRKSHGLWVDTKLLLGWVSHATSLCCSHSCLSTLDWSTHTVTFPLSLDWSSSCLGDTCLSEGTIYVFSLTCLQSCYVY